MRNRKETFYQKYIKRLIDIVLSLVAIIILSPLLLILYVLVKFKLGSPVIFTQKRPGKNENIFKLYKFRSMTDKKDGSGKLLPDDQRLTSFGRKLRSTSLDELPELFNILKGDMSIVGPRPLLVEYLPFYKEEERKRHDVTPGLTGWAQINGRNASSWEEKFEKDIYYVNNLSFFLDLKIILMTFFKVFKKSDILVGKEIPAGRLDDYRS
ncbi:sugar transferase [Anaerococcus vaginalis]|uniref:sugar transferase n=1 Tax=Anaerococcus vaginalis TaxID=33037 RepID=UPI00242BB9AE|nr:sugar transferase [Anaerococcus vaginalis]MDD7766935.1 sugar transferase [Anaerococcus vaginalis]